MSNYQSKKKMLSNSASLSNLASNFVKKNSDEPDIKDIITFMEAPWGLNHNPTTQPLFPAQKFILRMYYKLPLNETERNLVVKDRFNDRTLYTFTEQEYLNYLYQEGRCNIKYLDDKNRNELVLIAGRRGTKCFENSSLITTTVGTITAKELLTRLKTNEKIGIFTYNPKTWEKYITYDIKAESNGLRPILGITTNYGRSESVTSEHPYLIWRDSWLEPQWVKAQDLQIGDALAIAKSQKMFGTTSIGENKAKLLGYLLGDGGLTCSVKFSNLDQDIISEIQDILNTDFPNHIIKPITGTKCDYNLRSYDKCKTSEKNKVLNWLKEIKEYGKLAKHKRIPDCIKQAPKEEIALFLNRLFSCDGFVSIGKPDKQHKISKSSINITLAAKEFIDDIQRELLKFGIISNTLEQKVKFRNKIFRAWRLSILGKEAIATFSEQINIFRKEDKVLRALEFSSKKGPSKLKLNLLPNGAWNRILKIKKEKNLKDWQIHGERLSTSTRLRTQYCLTKEKASKYASNINDPVLKNLADSEIYWDKIKKIENGGISETVALEVLNTNIIGNDIISHNSTIASWIAAYETYRLLKIYHPQLYYNMLPDHEIHITTVATSEDQANLLFRNIVGYFNQCVYFHRYMNKPTNDKVQIRSRRDLDKYGESGKASIVINSSPCSARGVRGKNNIVTIMDEEAHFVEEDTQSNKSDKTVYDALTPSIAQFGRDGRIINISSPLNKSGLLWDLYNRSLEGAENILMIKAPSWEINTSLAPDFLRGRYHADPVTYDCEFGGEFSDRVKSWMPEEYLRRVIYPELKPKRNGKVRTPYFMGVDIGFKGDGTAIAISHVESCKDEEGRNVDRIEVDLVDNIAAGVGQFEGCDVLQFEDIADWIQNICSKFYVVKGLVDQYNGIVVYQNLTNRGLSQFEMIYHTKNFNSEMYQNFMMLTIDKKIKLYNEKTNEYNNEDSDLIEELLKLQVKQYSKNIIEVEAPKIKGHHDDRSDALMRSIWLATEAIKSGLISGSMSASMNKMGFVRDANHYQMIKARQHNIVDSKRTVRKNRLNSWAKKYG